MFQKPEELIFDHLSQTGETLAIAESLTGGLVSDKITNVPGSSSYFLLGVCSYANEAKINILRVKPETIKKFGAVSQECALEMLKGILKISGAKWGIATTGIAGPTGATQTKPIGLVYIAAGTSENYHCEKHIFSGDRLMVKEQSANRALQLLSTLF